MIGLTVMISAEKCGTINWMETEEGRKRATSEVFKIIDCVNNGLFPDFEI